MPANESKFVRSSLDDLAPNNSDKAKRGELKKDEPKKKLKPIVKGQVVKKKKTVFDKVKEAFLGESENIGDFLLYDIMIPAFRDTLSDMGFGVIERLFGDGRSRYRRGDVIRDRGRSYISYNTISNDSRRGSRAENRREINRSSRTRHDFENVIFYNVGEAEEVLAHLVDLVMEYGQVTVREFYELSNIETVFTDESYGWTNLRDAYVERTRDGYIIRFPPVRPL